MICQTVKSIEDILRVVLRITFEDERRNVRPGTKVSYFFAAKTRTIKILSMIFTLMLGLSRVFIVSQIFWHRKPDLSMKRFGCSQKNFKQTKLHLND